MRAKLIAAAVLTAMCLITNAAAQAKPFAEFKDVYQRELKNAGIVGSSFIFIKDNKVVFEDHYGFADAATSRRTNAATIYHWASNTKPFTGIAIMQLRDRGLLKLDDPVTKYLPELREIHNPFGSMDKITIRHLLTHSGGFRNGTWPWRNNKDWEPFEPQEYSQLVAMFPFTEVLFEPGTKYSYSNPAIIYLGRIIEVITKDEYEVYVDKNILRPLEMHRSYFDATPYHLLKDRSHSYYIEKGRRTEAKFDANTGVTVSNSGLNSPMADMAKYLNFLIGDRTKQDVYNEVLKRSSLEEMWQPQLSAVLDANGNKGFTTDIGLIYFLDRSTPRTFVGHGGDQNGFISYLVFEPASRSASLMVFNTTVADAGDAGDDVVSRLRRAAAKLF